MLVCGQVNPPPVSSTGYSGVYFSEKDDMQGKAKALKGTPLRVEHDDKMHVGRVLNGWTDATTGAMWALAEIDTQQLGGAMTAAAVEKGHFGEFSLGYVTKMQRNGEGVNATDKRIVELSIVKKGAREGCKIHMRADGNCNNNNMNGIGKKMLELKRKR